MAERKFIKVKMITADAPDGGWGWMVVIGVALTNITNQSLISVFGLLFGEKIERMGHGTLGVGLVLNISSLVTNLSGLTIGVVLNKYSARSVSFVGVLLTSTGLILSSFATTLPHLIITYGFFTGLGLGLIMPSTFIAVSSYFTTKKSLAVSWSMAGTGIGQMLMPHIVRFLLDKYGFRGSTLILGAISFHGLVGALLFQPVEWHQKKFGIEITEDTSLLSHNNNLDNGTKPLEVMKSDKINSRNTMVLDLSLLRDPKFIHILIGLSVVYSSSIAFSMLFPLYLQEAIGLTRAETVFSMSLLSAMDIVARLTIPFIATRLRLGNRVTFLYGAFILALCRSVLAEQSTFRAILLASAFIGFVRAATVINQNLTISEYCDNQQQLPAALGLNMVAKAIAVLTIGQFYGWIRDYTNSFNVCIHIQSLCLIIVAVTWSVEIIIRAFRSSS